MESKFKKLVKNIKDKLIILVIIWIVLDIIIVFPLTVAIANSTGGIAEIIQNFIQSVQQPLTAISLSFSNSDYISLFLNVFMYFTLIYIVSVIIIMSKAMPKSEYDHIEHGSSDWCEGGEQYRILSKKSGIILAEKNYLPLNKMGNVNVLVIRRLWSR